MRFKELISKLNEKANEVGTSDTTKNYASMTPGQPPVTFTPDTKYDAHKIAAELDPAGSIKHQQKHALSRQDTDVDGDVDAMDKLTPDEVTGTDSKTTLELIKKGAAERAHSKKGVAYESVMLEKLSASDDMSKWIKDFQDSDAPQFAGKSAEQRRKMAIAAKMQADRDAGKTESVTEEETPPFDKPYSPVGTPYKDKFGNTVKPKNIAKHLAKQGAADAANPNRKLRSDEKRVNGEIKRESVEEVEYISEAEDQSIERLRQLVRFGLMDKTKLPLITRAMKSLDKGSVTNPQERAVLFDLVNELIGIVTGDDSTFAKIRMQVQTGKE